MECANDIKKYTTKVNSQRVYVFLAGLDSHLDGANRQDAMLGRTSNEGTAMAARKPFAQPESKKGLMNWLDPSQHLGIVPKEYLDACPQNGNEEAAAIGKFMPHLKHLELRFSKLSVHGLVLITEGCPCLEYLDLFGCANLTSRDMETASTNLKNLERLVKPNFYIPRSVFHTERYGHWRLYDERFQTNVFQI
ncbi:hypothetical protein IFM89_035311 [Coptis chinensis]|uniref:Uncharacterized protein n=1 Tax=Coptis chinensis TaxID=261450 RepID=A0A835IE94_9MAGN|nr:hypothetical protein IFM89_035311 [Coptis chinensis]